MSSVPPTPVQSPRSGYVPPIGPGLKRLLYVVFGLLALLIANSGYLGGITFLGWWTGDSYEDSFYLWQILFHIGLGLIFLVPFLIFGITHLLQTRKRKNKRAIRVGYALFITALIVLGTGLLLVRVGDLFDLKNPVARSTVYWLHVIGPFVAGWMYWLHRLVGQRIQWRVGAIYAGVLGVSLALLFVLKTQDPRDWNVAGPKEGADKYFFPSLARTSTGNFIPADTLMMDDAYCAKCHADAHKTHGDSVHRFSSFNNPAYLASVRETRKVSMEKHGNMRSSRWCAGCHDPVPFFSGAFDDPNFDDVKDKTSQAGITCTVCHAITNINSPRGNADYTIEEPLHYPFASSKNPLLQYVNNQLVKAKPAFHKKTFLKPFHKTTEFCSTCHKVHLPPELNDYKWLRGQNHYDAFLLSGVSGHGTRSFYYPPKAQPNCNGCHMPLLESQDFGAKFFATDKKSPQIHNHMFPSANTAIAWWRDKPDVIQAHQEFLQGVMRVDVFGVREGGTIDSPLTAPLRPEVPALKPGTKYLFETVVRTAKMGHLFTQGTVDSNEVWLDVTVKSGDRIIGRSGGLEADRSVDQWSHFLNVFMLDRNGNRIDRRNAQDIFTPLYNHQIPPGAAATVHYGFQVPEGLTEPITVELKLQYRKFDQTYVDLLTKASKPGDNPIRGYTPGKPYLNPLPITTLAADSMTFPVVGIDKQPKNEVPKPPAWERWNDYGIGMFLKGRAELRQAEEAFKEVEKLKRFDGPLNLARLYFTEGRLDEAVAALAAAAKYTDPKPYPWTLAWLTGLVNRQQGYLAEAEINFRSALDDNTTERIERKFDFTKDYEVRNALGETLFDRAKQLRGEANAAERKRILEDSVTQFLKTLAIDPENVTAHHNLHLLYVQLGDQAKAVEHQKLHLKYKPDDNATGQAFANARKKYPAANHAAENLVIYDLQRAEAPELSKTPPPQTPSQQTQAAR